MIAIHHRPAHRARDAGRAIHALFRSALSGEQRPELLQPLLIHPKSDGLDRIGEGHGHFTRFVVLDQNGEEFETVGEVRLRCGLKVEERTENGAASLPRSYRPPPGGAPPQRV